MTFERPNIASMQGYTSGEQPDGGEVIKLNTNENPYPPSPAVSAAIAGFAVETLRRYPQPTADVFRDAAATLHGINRDEVIATRGGDELLRLVITTYVDPGQRIGMTDPTYSLYPVLADIQGCPIFKQPLESDWGLAEDFARQLNDNDCRLAFVVNPHAPSGQLVSTQRLRAIADEFKGVLLIDEAYVDFIDGGYDSISLIREFDNVILLRTLSKGYSLAGLRFGYGMAAPSLITPMLAKTRDSYNLDALGQVIATAAIQDQDYAKQTWASVREQRVLLQSSLIELGLSVPDSQANFLLAGVNAENSVTAQDIYRLLKEQGLLVRYFAIDRLADKLRISVGSETENARLINLLEDILG